MAIILKYICYLLITLYTLNLNMLHCQYFTKAEEYKLILKLWITTNFSVIHIFKIVHSSNTICQKYRVTKKSLIKWIMAWRFKIIFTSWSDKPKLEKLWFSRDNYSHVYAFNTIFKFFLLEYGWFTLLF